MVGGYTVNNTHTLRLTSTHMVTVEIRLLPHHQDHCPELPAFAITDYTMNMCESACVCACVRACACVCPCHFLLACPMRYLFLGDTHTATLPTLQNHLTLSNSNILQSANIVIIDKRGPSIPIEKLHVHRGTSSFIVSIPNSVVVLFRWLHCVIVCSHCERPSDDTRVIWIPEVYLCLLLIKL